MTDFMLDCRFRSDGDVDEDSISEYIREQLERKGVEILGMNVYSELN